MTRTIHYIRSLQAKTLAGLIVAVVASTGVLAVAVYATVNVYSSTEAESASRTGNVALVSDTTASGSNMIKFGETSEGCETTGPGGYALPDLEGYTNSCNTGVRHACTSTYNGDFITSSDGQTIQDLCIDGALVINHNNVTVRDVRIAPTSGQLYLLDIGKNAATCPTGLNIEYTEVDNSGVGNMDWGIYQRCAPATGVHRFDHVKVENIGRGALIEGNIVITNMYIYSRYTAEGAHRTALSSHGGDNFTVSNSSFVCVNTGCSSAVNMYSDYAPITNYTLQNNVLSGGSICLRAGSSHQYGDQTHDIKILNNRFSTVYAPLCGTLQAFAFFDAGAPGNVRSGNVWHETGTPVTGE